MKGNLHRAEGVCEGFLGGGLQRCVSGALLPQAVHSPIEQQKTKIQNYHRRLLITIGSGEKNHKWDQSELPRDGEVGITKISPNLKRNFFIYILTM